MLQGFIYIIIYLYGKGSRRGFFYFIALGAEWFWVRSVSNFLFEKEL